MYEYLWLIYALIATISRGFNSFFLKTYSIKNYNQNLLVIYDVFWAFIFSIIYLIINIDIIKFEINPLILILIILVSIGMSTTKKLIYVSLDNISSSIYFINSRIFTSILIIIFSTIFLNEFLTLKQSIGIIFGIFTFFLLYEKSDIPKLNSNFKMGIISLTCVILLFTFLNISHKIVLQSTQLPLYVFLFSIGNLIFSILFYSKTIKQEIFNLNKNLNKLIYTFFSSLLLIIALIHLFKAYTIQNISIVYKIFSFEIFIPIFLSIIIYKEKLTLKKGLAFLLTIITILFFI